MSSPCVDRRTTASAVSSLNSLESFGFHFIEPLEPRIAPASLNVGAIGGTPPSDAFNYTDAESPAGPTPFILAANSTDAEIKALFTGSVDHYYLPVGRGLDFDVLNIYTGSGLAQGVKVSSGISYLFFHDANTNGIVESGEMTGISLSSGAGVQVFAAMGSVNGDILVNLNGKTGAFSSTDLNLDAKGISSLKISGNIEGSILSGGSINNVTVSGTAESILTGTATGGFKFDLGGGQPQGQGTLDSFVPPTNAVGPAISNLNLGSIDLIQAGDGAAGKAGGSISNVTIQNDIDGFTIQAGNGGAGAGSVANGGAGGSINKVVVFGVFDAVLLDTITIQSGDGGDGTATGNGGAGGNISSVWVGYETKGNTLIKSTDYLGDFVCVLAGDGGDGKSGGRGGSLSDINARVAPSDLAPFGSEICFFAGNGGDALDARGKSGDGGNVNKFFAVNAYDLIANPDSGVSVQAGDAGSAVLANISGKGGLVSNGTILSRVIDVGGGDGSSAASTGGAGGSISNLRISFPGDAALIQFGQGETNIDGVFAEEVSVISGLGGNSLTKGKGGAGGEINNVTAPDTDLNLLSIAAAAGGNSANGAGGNGGKISGVRFDSDRDTGNEVNAIISTGIGGNGTTAGGVGGDLVNSVFFLNDAKISFTAGDGGNGGNGGNGGSVRGASFVADGNYLGVPGAISVSAGDGGNASDKFKAGNGGSIIGTRAEKITLLGAGDVSVTAGDGGTSNTGATGNGGNLGDLALRASAPNASILISAGDAGVGLNPSKGGNGGNITSVNALADLNIRAIAGKGASGTSGGHGGSIQTFSFGANTLAAPGGNITVQAGQGANGTNLGGNGGSLTDIVGYSSSNLASNVIFTAGDGGDSDRNGGKGGSITSFTVLGGKAEFSITAGNAGDASASGTGGVGGSVSTVTVSPNLVLRDVAAGDGGDSLTGKGGLGGTVRNVTTTGAIGVLSGDDFGFGQAGGVFAGAGGSGGKTDGAAGSVTDIVAQSIASIVAGREATPGFVTKVDGIFLNGLNQLTTNAGGGFANFSSANFIGSSSLADPSVVNGSRFNYDNNSVPATFVPGTTNAWNTATQTPLDGLVAALVLTGRRNVAPNAFLTLDAAGAAQLITRNYNAA